MPLTLHLPPELETQLIAQAQAQGMEIEAYLRSLIQMHLAQTHSLSENTSIAETKAPSLSDEAISHNSIHQVENSPKRYPAKAGSAKGLVWMSDDFDEP
jgi:hypothetical protein